MTKEEQLRRKIIEAIYGESYDECEGYKEPIAGGATFIHAPITIGKIMQALSNKGFINSSCVHDGYFFLKAQTGNKPNDIYIDVKIKLTNDTFQEVTLDDQDDQDEETTHELLKLFK